MSALTHYQGLVSSLKCSQLGRCYVFTGIEEWFVGEATRAIIDHAFAGQDEGLRAFNLVVLDGDEESLPKILQEIQTPPFFAGHKVVRVRQAKFLKGGKGEATEKNRLPLAVTSPNITLICEGESLNQKSLLLKGQEVQLLNFTFANRRDALSAAQTLVREELAPFSMQIEMAALNHLLGLVGVSEKEPFARLLVGETRKIAAYKNYRGNIAVADVAAMVSRSAEAKLWDVTDALAAKAPEKALKHLEEVLRDGEEPLVVLATLAGFFRQLLLAREMYEDNLPIEEAVSHLANINVHRFVAEKAYRAAPHFTRPQLERWLTNCFDLSQELKSGKTNPSVALELLIVEVATRGSR